MDTDDSGGGRNVTNRDLWRVLTDQTKTLSDHEKALARIGAILDSAIELVRQQGATQQRLVERLEQANIDGIEMSTMLNSVKEALAQNTARLIFVDEWRARHEEWAKDREREVMALQRQTQERDTRVDVLRDDVMQTQRRMDEHEKRAHVAIEDIPVLKEMATAWTRSRTERGALISKLKETAFSAPFLILIGATTVFLGVWLQHLTHLIK